jgi:UDP-4-amino-4,6-dideoxy-N-acetyl-beta-L-altrosamine transaminase
MGKAATGESLQHGLEWLHHRAVATGLNVVIPYGRQDITQADIDAVQEVLRSDWLTQGPVVPRFEQAVADCCGAGYAIAVNSATSALHLACLALGLGPGDRLWTTPITFVASANCGLYCGAQVDFVDIDPHTYTLCPKTLEEKLQQADQHGQLPKVIIPVHLCGQSCDMAAIHRLSQRYGFRIIEDASHALGGTYNNQAIGNCRYSDITVLSFHPVKMITSGEGGMALTPHQPLADKMARLRSHGITRDPAQMTHTPDGPWYYQQIELGYNYRRSDIQAALGLSQLQRLNHYLTRRRALAQRYDDHFTDLPITLPWQHPDSHSAWHLYVIRLQLDRLTQTHQHIFIALRDQGIGVNVHYIPVHLQPWYRQMGFQPGDFPQAERYYQQAISLPIYPLLDTHQQDQVIQAITRVLR